MSSMNLVGECVWRARRAGRCRGQPASRRSRCTCGSIFFTAGRRRSRGARSTRSPRRRCRRAELRHPEAVRVRLVAEAHVRGARGSSARVAAAYEANSARSPRRHRRVARERVDRDDRPDPGGVGRVDRVPQPVDLLAGRRPQTGAAQTELRTITRKPALRASSMFAAGIGPLGGVLDPADDESVARRAGPEQQPARRGPRQARARRRRGGGVDVRLATCLGFCRMGRDRFPADYPDPRAERADHRAS